MRLARFYVHHQHLHSAFIVGHLNAAVSTICYRSKWTVGFVTVCNALHVHKASLWE